MHITPDPATAERLFRATFEEAPIGTALAAFDGSWLRVNQALATLLGFSVEALESRLFVSLSHPDDFGRLQAAIRALLEGETSGGLECRLCARDGGYVPTLVMPWPQKTAGAMSFLVSVVDLRPIEKAHVALVASETRYRRLFETAKDGILILDADSSTVVDANPFMTAMTGFTRDELLGNKIWEIGPFKDRAASKESFAELQAQGYVRYDDLPLQTRDGRRVDVEFVSNVYPVEGVEVIQCNIRDISERRRAEEAARIRDRAMAAVSQGILITDATLPHNPLIYLSPGFAEITGYPTEYALGKSCNFLQGPQTDPVALQTIRDAIRKGRACMVEPLNYRKDGTTFWNNLALSPVRDEQGNLVNFIGVQTDVTARRQLEAQFLQAQKMEVVGRLAGGIAHDFNNLLTVILGYADMIAEGLGRDEAPRPDVEEIRVAALLGAGLTRQLLAFSRLQVVQASVMNLNVALDGMQNLLGRLLGAGIEVVLRSEPGLGNMKADPGQIEQIFLNLAVNARDAMPHGGRLTVETANVELDAAFVRAHLEVQPGPYVMLAVTDTGTGMDPATLARIFEPFFTTKGEGKGTGLGLATVFRIVQQSQGYIFVVSEVGQGTDFKLYFPRLGEVVLGEAPPDPAVEAAEREPAVGTILLVEDQHQVRAVAQSILRRAGYTVLEAPNAGEALLICEQHIGTIDLLLTDVVLPRMNGRQLVERLAPMRPAMRVLYMSGYTDDATLLNGIVDDEVAFLSKPFTPASLIRRVREVLRGGEA